MAKRAIFASATVLLILGIQSMAHAQYVRSCGKVSPLTPQGGAPVTDAEGRPYIEDVRLQFIPSLCVSERYDSNIFFAPKTPGLDRSDFVTDVNPQVRINHNGEYVAGLLDVGGFYESYVRNSDLNYFGTVNTLYLNLDNSIKRLLPNASFIISDGMRYSQLPPGFSSPVAGTSPGSPVNLQNLYAQGLLSYRANNLTNSASALFSYKVTPLTTINASYSNAIIRFGNSHVTSSLALFDTTANTGTVGATTQVTALDALTLNYSYVQFEFSPHSSTTTLPSNSFVTNTATLAWSRTFAPYLRGSVGGGVIVIDPGITTYALNASLIFNTDNHSATVSYVRSAFPSFVGVGVPLVSDVVSLSALQRLALNWELDEYASFSHSSGVNGAGAIAYNSYFAGMDLYYWITKIWSSGLTVDYMNFNQTFGRTSTHFDRYAVTLNLKATWN